MARRHLSATHDNSSPGEGTQRHDLKTESRPELQHEQLDSKENVTASLGIETNWLDKVESATSRLQKQFDMKKMTSLSRLSNVSAGPVDIMASSMTANNNTIKTLVIVMGSIRGGEHAWQSMYENLLDINQADLALAVGVPNEQKNSSLYARANYVWEFEEFEDWGAALDMIASQDNPAYNKSANTSWRAILADECPDILGGVIGFPGSGGLILWVRWFISNKITELQLLQKYDRFVVTRSDFFYLCEFDFSKFDVRKVWVPYGEDWGGITDRFVLAPSNKILPVLDIIPPILKEPAEYVLLLHEMFRTEKPFRFNPEMFIQLRWQMQGIRAYRFPRMMFTCAVAGDATRWHFPSQDSHGPNGVMLKHKNEYYDSLETCGYDFDPYNNPRNEVVVNTGRRLLIAFIIISCFLLSLYCVKKFKLRMLSGQT